MTQTKNPAWMEKFTPTQLEYFYSIPGWAVTTWGIATWGSMVAAIVLLLRKRLAVALYTVALIGMVATTVYSFVLSDGMKVMGGTAPLIFNAIIFIISVLEIIYARAMRARGVLT
ncbi:hypothetical protein [Oleiharenicola lentus]|uniref:hypothetical protein n=1 Tax=Oleiharenicola lentus TaxID=2508720 RepID=UPI003F66544B